MPSPTAITGFTFDDVTPGARKSISPRRAQLVDQTFDGLIDHHATPSSKDAATGSRFRPSAARHHAHMAAQGSARIDARAAGWAYKLADEQGRQFIMTAGKPVEAQSGDRAEKARGLSPVRGRAQLMRPTRASCAISGTCRRWRAT